MAILAFAIGFVAFIAATGSLTLGLAFLPAARKLGKGKRSRACMWLAGLCLTVVLLAGILFAASAYQWRA